MVNTFIGNTLGILLNKITGSTKGEGEYGGIINIYLKINYFKSERNGTLEYKLHWWPKFFNYFILFIGLKTLGSFIERSLFRS